MKLVLARPDWDRLDLESLDPELREFLCGMRDDMARWLNAIELPERMGHADPMDSVEELNVVLGLVLRGRSAGYLSALVEKGELPLRYPPEREAELREALVRAGRAPDEIRCILYGPR
jgi:hypothetical protein